MVLGFFVGIWAAGFAGAVPVEVDLGESHRLEVRVSSRTVEMGFANWVAELPAERRGMEAVAGADGVPNIWKFALEAPGPLAEIPGARVRPHWVRVRAEEEGGFYYGLEFTRKREPRWSGISYSLKRRMDGGDWEVLPEPVAVGRADAGNGLERVVLSDGVARRAEERPEFRLLVELEARRTFFVHYMSDLNPGWKAMAYLTTPEPAYLRLFHDRKDRMEPGEDGYFRSTGGVNRDLPLVPPGFSFDWGKESAALEIRRARRAGVDGFAVNCLSGKTDFVEHLFEAAAEIYRKEGGEPFQVGLSVDINVLPHEDGKLLVAVADLIGTWLKMGEGRKRSPHLARRGGLPMVMGYQSNWIWIDYLHRLLEVWEWERGLREENLWLAEFGERPEGVELPEAAILVYEEAKGEGLPMQEVRHRAVRAWANSEDGWRHIRPAYRLLERMVGEEIFWQFDAIEMDAMAKDLEGAMRVVAREFPAVNMFLSKGKATGIVRRVVHEEGAEWGEPIYTQYVAYGQNERDGYFLGNFRDTVATERMREGWYRAIGLNLETGEAVGGGTSSLLQYTTWNDFNEHSHIAPSLGLRYSLTELTGRLADVWKTGGEAEESGEEVFVFYRKYPEWAVERTFPFPHKGDYKEAAFEAVTILREPAVVELWGERRGERFLRAEPVRVEAGFRVTRFAGEAEDLWAEGKVGIRVRTESGRELEAAGWEEITHRPFRQDVTLVGASSRCDVLWAEDAPKRGMRDFRFAEYGDEDGDGSPNWYEMLYSGRGWLKK